MRTYQSRTRVQLGLSEEDWEQLKQFIDKAQDRISNSEQLQRVESPPPHFQNRSTTRTPTTFHAGGWVGKYPGGVTVSPEKINEFEYEFLIEEVAGWLELWDIPTASAVLPLMTAETLEERSILLGYSHALMLFTEEALAHRPPVSVEWDQEQGPEPRGPLDIHKTIKARAQGSREVIFDRHHFSLEHPLNLLLIRFHAQLGAELESLGNRSVLMGSTIEQHRRYHEHFIETAFPEEFFDRSTAMDFTDPEVLDQARRESPKNLTELVDLWESYLQNQTLNISFDQDLNVGIKPIEKLYELWILKELVSVVSNTTGHTPIEESDGLRQFTFSDEVTLYYNTSLDEYSNFLVPAFDSHPGRPDYALAVDDTIVWIGDAKFSQEATIGLEDYRRFLSYVIDLMAAGENAAASIIYVSEATESPGAVTSDYSIEQMPFRPKAKEVQREALEQRLRSCLDRLERITP